MNSLEYFLQDENNGYPKTSEYLKQYKSLEEIRVKAKQFHEEFANRLGYSVDYFEETHKLKLYFLRQKYKLSHPTIQIVRFFDFFNKDFKQRLNIQSNKFFVDKIQELNIDNYHILPIKAYYGNKITNFKNTKELVSANNTLQTNITNRMDGLEKIFTLFDKKFTADINKQKFNIFDIINKRKIKIYYDLDEIQSLYNCYKNLLANNNKL